MNFGLEMQEKSPDGDEHDPDDLERQSTSDDTVIENTNLTGNGTQHLETPRDGATAARDTMDPQLTKDLENVQIGDNPWQHVPQEVLTGPSLTEVREREMTEKQARELDLLSRDHHA